MIFDIFSWNITYLFSYDERTLILKYFILILLQRPIQSFHILIRIYDKTNPWTGKKNMMFFSHLIQQSYIEIPMFKLRLVQLLDFNSEWWSSCCVIKSLNYILITPLCEDEDKLKVYFNCFIWIRQFFFRVFGFLRNIRRPTYYLLFKL